MSSPSPSQQIDSSSVHLESDAPSSVLSTPSDTPESSGNESGSTHEQSPHVGPESHSPLPAASLVETNAETNSPASVPSADVQTSSPSIKM